MPGVSIHVVDVTRGLPARGMRVALLRLEAGVRTTVGEGHIGDDGVLTHPMTSGEGIRSGEHEVELAAGADFRSVGIAVGDPAFLEMAAFRFTIVDAAEHYHLPVKLSPWGLSIWRGR
jgi:5-hydroxyisourate hydrolase